MQRQQTQRVHKIMSETRIDSLRILFGLPLFLINADKFLSLAGIFAKAVVGDPIKPGGKLRFAAKASNVSVSADECILSEIIGECDVAASKLAQQTSHARLMPADQLAKSVLVVIDKDSSNEVNIG